MLKYFRILPLLVSIHATAAEEAAPKPEHKDGMVRLPDATYEMGSVGAFDTAYGRKEFPEEAPVHQVTVKGFWIDETEVTNDQFAAFVKATGYETFAERKAKAEDFPPQVRASLPPDVRQGSLIFNKPAVPVGDPNYADISLWWSWNPDANWRQPTGKGSSLEGKGNHPVVCVNFEDASAYVKWAGKRLPTEAEWEYAARGGLKGRMYAWGDEMKVDGKWMANSFQGTFPHADSADDGFSSTAPAKTFPANGYGLSDMAGNVWEICSDFYDADYPKVAGKENPTGPVTWVNPTTREKSGGKAHHVIKGGSYLCHISYCMRYRPASRQSLEEDSPANHTGFRCVKD